MLNSQNIFKTSQKPSQTPRHQAEGELARGGAFEVTQPLNSTRGNDLIDAALDRQKKFGEKFSMNSRTQNRNQKNILDSSLSNMSGQQRLQQPGGPGMINREQQPSRQNTDQAMSDAGSRRPVMKLPSKQTDTSGKSFPQEQKARIMGRIQQGELSPSNLSEANKLANPNQKRLKVALQPYNGGKELDSLMQYIEKKRFKGKPSGELRMNIDMASNRDIKTANNSHLNSAQSSNRGSPPRPIDTAQMKGTAATTYREPQTRIGSSQQNLRGSEVHTTRHSDGKNMSFFGKKINTHRSTGRRGGSTMNKTMYEDPQKDQSRNNFFKKRTARGGQRTGINTDLSKLPEFNASKTTGNYRSTREMKTQSHLDGRTRAFQINDAISHAKLDNTNTSGDLGATKLSVDARTHKVHSPDSHAISMHKGGGSRDLGDISKLQTNASHNGPKGTRNLSDMSKSVMELKSIINKQNKLGASGISGIGSGVDLSKSLTSGGKLSRDMITPEIAAFVVKEYLLPMFESDGKRLLSKKKDLEKRKKSRGGEQHAMSGDEDTMSRGQSQGAAPGVNLDQKQEAFNQLMEKDYAQVQISGTQQLGGKAGASINLMDNKTVFSELKLSEILLSDIEEFRDEVRRREKYEEEQTNLIHQLQKEYNDAQNIISKLKLQEKLQQQELKAQRQELQNLKQKVKQQKQQLQNLQKLNNQNDKFRKQFCENLMKAKLGYEHSKNNLIQMQTRQAVLNYEADNMRSRLSSLYEAIGSLGDAKLLQDQHEAKIRFIEEKKKKMENDWKDLQQKVVKATEENKEKDQVIRDIQKRVNKVKEEKERYETIFKEKVIILDREREEAVMIRRQSIAELNKIKNLLTQVTNERDALKMKLQKMKQRKVVDVSSKLCVNCGADFNDKENYNWSCQVHRSEYGDHMWWCCGKRDINAPGCKYQKHTTREDKVMDLDDQDMGQLRQIRCMCCKEFGHTAEECPKDPNYRSAFNIIEEDDRIENMQDSKKLNQDAGVLTMRMLTELSKNKVKLKGKDMMSFDDYQYSNVNQYILDICLNPKKKRIKPVSGDGGSSSSGDNSENEAPESDGDSGEKARKAAGKQQVRLFSDDEVLDIEEAQEKNAFNDLQEKLESNFLEIENDVIIKHMSQKKNKGKDEEEEHMDIIQNKPFNFLGVKTMVNLHDHVDQLAKENEDREFKYASMKNRKQKGKGKRKNLSMFPPGQRGTYGWQDENDSQISGNSANIGSKRLGRDQRSQSGFIQKDSIKTKPLSSLQQKRLQIISSGMISDQRDNSMGTVDANFGRLGETTSAAGFNDQRSDVGSNSTHNRVRRTPMVFKGNQDSMFETKTKLTLENLEKAFPENMKKQSPQKNVPPSPVKQNAPGADSDKPPPQGSDLSSDQGSNKTQDSMIRIFLEDPIPEEVVSGVNTFVDAQKKNRLKKQTQMKINANKKVVEKNGAGTAGNSSNTTTPLNRASVSGGGVGSQRSKNLRFEETKEQPAAANNLNLSQDTTPPSDSRSPKSKPKQPTFNMEKNLTFEDTKKLPEIKEEMDSSKQNSANDNSDNVDRKAQQSAGPSKKLNKMVKEKIMAKVNEKKRMEKKMAENKGGRDDGKGKKTKRSKSIQSN